MKKILLTVAIVSVVGLSGCASTAPVQNVMQNNGNNAEPSPAEKEVRILATKVESQFESAKTENYVYFAPDSWKKVNFLVRNMRTLVAEFNPYDQGFFGGPSESKVLKQIRESQNALDNAAQIKRLVTQFLKQPLADYLYLSPLIQNQRKNELSNINHDIANLIIDIEKEDSTSGFEERRANIQARLLQLEINITKSIYYAPLLMQMESLNKELIPQTYAQIEQDLLRLNDAIGFAPRQMDVLDPLILIVKEDLFRANNISLEVKWINSIKDSESEKIVLYYRHTLTNLVSSLLKKDISSLAYSDQVSQFNNEISQLLAQQATLTNKQAALIADLTAKLNAMLADAKPTTASESAAPSVLVTHSVINDVEDK